MIPAPSVPEGQITRRDRLRDEAAAWRRLAERIDSHTPGVHCDTSADAMGVSQATWALIFARIDSYVDPDEGCAFDGTKAENLQPALLACLWLALDAEDQAKIGDCS